MAQYGVISLSTFNIVLERMDSIIKEAAIRWFMDPREFISCGSSYHHHCIESDHQRWG